MMDVVVSIIMAVFNGEEYIQQAIDSVLSQSHENWELLIVNDGSTDKTHDIVLGVKDPRVRYFEQVHRGVSCARNIGLKNMVGDYFCFLDADDILPPNSIFSRLSKFFEDSTSHFVDGSVVFFIDDYKVIRRYTPAFTGDPLRQLFLLNGKCFAGLSWMVKRKRKFQYLMNEKITHGEDLFFYMELARGGGNYTYVKDEIYLYRQHPASSMRNVAGLENGYLSIYQHLSKWVEFSMPYRFVFKWRVRKFMVLEYLRQRQPRAALLSLWR